MAGKTNKKRIVVKRGDVKREPCRVIYIDRPNKGVITIVYWMCCVRNETNRSVPHTHGQRAIQSHTHARRKEFAKRQARAQQNKNMALIMK